MSSPMKPSTREDYERRIARVVAAIEAEPSAPHRLADLAALAHFSPYHFNRIYSAMRGENVFDTIRRARLARAAHDLVASPRKVIDIGQDAGFDSAQSFARAFKALVSLSPTAFRRLGKPFAEFVSGGTPQRQEVEMQVDIVEQAPLRVYGLRHEGNVAKISEVWRDVSARAMAQGLVGKIEMAVGLCHDAPDAEGNVVYHAGFVLREATPVPQGLEIVEAPGGRYACYRHVGPYTGIPAAFGRLFGEWLPASGYEVDDRPALELYRNNPYDTPSNALITDLLLPVR
jgi:AraC family transcriptional regulator